MSSHSLKIQMYSQDGAKVKEMDLNARIFGVAPKESVVHQVAMAQMANARTPIAHAKLKSEVRGGGIKPWKQKGTGRARHGSIRSPLWVGGGVVFGPRNTVNFKQKVNKKMKTKALFMCLTDKVINHWIVLVDNLNLTQGKTKEMTNIIKNLKEMLEIKTRKNKAVKEKEEKNNDSEQKFDIKKQRLSLLIILSKSDKKVFQAGRNLMNIKITTADSLNVLDLLKYERVLIDSDSLPVLETTYLKV